MGDFYKIFETKMIKNLDQYTVENEPVSSIDFMERASKVWVEKFLDLFSKTTPVSVVCGAGNNGGDGFVIARMLRKLGFRVTVYHIPAQHKLSPNCEYNRKRYENMGGSEVVVEKIKDFNPDKSSILIDAIYGTGLNKNVTGLESDVIKKINSLGTTVVAVDIPSGLMGEDNSSNDHDSIVRANYTFTFQLPKLSFLFSENDEYVGDWCILNVGLSEKAIESLKTKYYYVRECDVVDMIPVPHKFAHKGMNGKGLLIAGKIGMMGACMLAARSAVRSGLGLLYCHVPAAASGMVQLCNPEAIVDSDNNDYFSEIGDLSKYDAIAVGPGIGQNPETVKSLKSLLTSWKGRMVIDADAINIISSNKDMMSLLNENCVLTPHAIEFDRLAGKSNSDYERLCKLCNFAHKYKVNIVLKGAFSVLATSSGDCYFNTSGNPGMATAGSGDVLTGVLLAMLASGMPITSSIIAGVYAHGLSGDIAIDTCGMRGLTAMQIADGMGCAWKRLERRPIPDFKKVV